MPGIRTRGLVLASVGAILAAPLIYLNRHHARGFLLHPLIFLTAIPVLLLLIGLLELTTGVPIARMEKKWNVAPRPIQIALAVLLVSALLALLAQLFYYALKSATGP